MEIFDRIEMSNALFALLLLILGFFLARFLSRMLRYVMENRFSAHQMVLTRRLVFYSVFALFVMSAFHQLGMNLGVLLGAAGILSVALGFAAQTSMSNLISGLFVLGERAFSIGDVIRVGSTTGEVISVDLLSIKLRTFDNLFVRIPNETIIKSEVTNLTRFDIRRIDLQLGVAYKEDLENVQAILNGIVNEHVNCLEEPEPLIILTGFADSAVTLQFSFYVERANFLKVRNEMYLRIKKAFDEAGIEIPFPHRSLYAGSVTEPFPVQVVAGQSPNDSQPTETR
jgi:small-conductance mechanosensitive channel